LKESKDLRAGSKEGFLEKEKNKRARANSVTKIIKNFKSDDNLQIDLKLKSTENSNS